MIIKSRRHRAKPGQYVPDGEITDHNGYPHKIPFVVIEEVSKEDYINECTEEDKHIGMIFDDDLFYRISVD